MEWNDSAIVLETGKFRESDLWLRIFSQNRGIMTVFAFGGSRSRRRFCGCLDVLNTIHCRVKSSRNGQYLALEEGTLLRGPQKLRYDLNRLGMVSNCIKFLQIFGIAEDGAAKVFAFVQEMLLLFEESVVPHTLFPVLFRMRIAAEQGFAPAFASCAICETNLSDKESIFYMDEGLCRCKNCVANGKSLAYTMQLPAKVSELLQKVIHLPPSHWGVGGLLPFERSACFRAVDGFVQYHLGIVWEDGRFRRI